MAFLIFAIDFLIAHDALCALSNRMQAAPDGSCTPARNILGKRGFVRHPREGGNDENELTRVSLARGIIGHSVVA